jgi:arginase
MSERIQLHLIGCASGIAGVDSESGSGPLTMQSSPFMNSLNQEGIEFSWDVMVQPPQSLASGSIDESVKVLCDELAVKVCHAVSQQQFFSVIGGDHSCAIGTWSGVQHALHQQGDVGLIWIDAHMDAHTPETSHSGRIHGMPVACLLGHGHPSLTTILNQYPKIKPQNLCLIGIRSYESGEAELLKRLNVKVYFMDEVKQRGFDVILNEAVSLVSRNTLAYGLTLDLDAIDPEEAPGVDVPESDGIHVKDLIKGLSNIATDPRLIATEIVEFDPTRDKDHITEQLIVSLLAVIADGKKLKF